MPGITIRDADERHVLVVDLAGILNLVGERALHSRWLVSGVDAPGGETADELGYVSDNHVVVTGERLLELAQGVWQIIDGKFQAFENDSASPWLTIYAVDSSAYDVVCKDVGLLDRLKSTFRAVSDLPESAL
jgi:hypothetical protein